LRLYLLYLNKNPPLTDFAVFSCVHVTPILPRAVLSLDGWSLSSFSAFSKMG
jgi:hypothetical protein